MSIFKGEISSEWPVVQQNGWQIAHKDSCTTYTGYLSCWVVEGQFEVILCTFTKKIYLQTRYSKSFPTVLIGQ